MPIVSGGSAGVAIQVPRLGSAVPSIDPSDVVSDARQVGANLSVDLRNPAVGILPNEGAIYHHDLRDVKGKPIVGFDLFDPMFDLLLLIDGPLPEGAYVAAGFSAGDVAAAVRGFGIQLRGDAGDVVTGARLYNPGTVWGAIDLAPPAGVEVRAARPTLGRGHIHTNGAWRARSHGGQLLLEDLKTVVAAADTPVAHGTGDPATNLYTRMFYSVGWWKAPPAGVTTATVDFRAEVSILTRG